MTVLDAYGVIAYLNDEPAAADVAVLLSSEDCLTTAVGLAEVIDQMVRLKSVDPDELAADLAALGLAAPMAVDGGIARSAGRLRARRYHRLRCAVSMADCVAAAAVRQISEPLATSDPHLLDLCHAEHIATTVLPASNGSVWTPP